MPTTQTQNGAPTLDAAFEPVKRLHGQVLTAAHQAGSLYADTYDTTVDRGIGLELQVAELTRPEWLENLLAALARFAREIADASATATRNLLS